MSIEHDFDGHGGCVVDCRMCRIDRMATRAAETAKLRENAIKLAQMAEDAAGDDTESGGAQAFHDTAEILRAVPGLLEDRERIEQLEALADRAVERWDRMQELSLIPADKAYEAATAGVWKDVLALLRPSGATSEERG